MASHFYLKFGKRAFDISVAALGLLLTAPIMAVTAVTVRVKLGNPVLFTQMRPGKDMKSFRLYKFRTMTSERDAEGNLLPDSARITKFGSLLRTTSIDELPELFNILRGDMSFVGPRPLLTRYNPYFTESELRRFKVRPGLTGLAQVQGRNTTNWDDRLSHDVEYVENLNFIMDLKIFLKTLYLVGKREGVVIVPDAQMLDLDEERKGPKSGT